MHLGAARVSLVPANVLSGHARGGQLGDHGDIIRGQFASRRAAGLHWQGSGLIRLIGWIQPSAGYRA